MYHPQLVSVRFLLELFASATEHPVRGYVYEPEGLFYTLDPVTKKYVAVDNSTGEAWTEEFDDMVSAVVWLSRQGW